MYIYSVYIIVLQNGRWGGESLEEGESQDRLVTYPCPQHYCQCLKRSNEAVTCSFLFDPKQPNKQCICGRQGVIRVLKTL